MREGALCEPFCVGLVHLAPHLGRVDELETCARERVSAKRAGRGRATRKGGRRTLHGREGERGREAGRCRARDGLDRREATLCRLRQFRCEKPSRVSSTPRAAPTCAERDREPTFAPRFRNVGPHPPARRANHAHALHIVVRADLLLGLAKLEPVLQLAQLGLRVRLLGLASTARRASSQSSAAVSGRNGRGAGKRSATHRFPPRRFFFCASGLGNALTTLLGAGLAKRSISLSSLPFISSPNDPVGALLAMSTRAASATFAPILRCAFMRSSARVCCTSGHW